MASHSIGATRHGIAVGSVFGRSIDVIRSNPVVTLGITFALIALPQLIFGQIGWGYAAASAGHNGTYAVVFLTMLIVGVLWLVTSGALVQAAIDHDQGQSADPLAILQRGVQRALPLFAVYLLFVIAVSIASMFLLVPGIMLAVMWAVCMPAVVAERTGVFGAFARSRALTKGARWHVFGILLLALVIYLLVSMVIGVASVAGYGSIGALTGGGTVAMPIPHPSLLTALLQAIVTTVLLTWFTILGASLFIELRHWKDGPDADRLADIFS